jgi:two-component system LytT family response regulator
MQPYRALIVDDERLARQRIRRLLGSEPAIAIAGECANGPQAVSFLREQPVDLLFLDVQMPGLDGFGVLRALDRVARPVTIFVTAYDEYALRAFEVNALDYLLKPFDRKRFQTALERAKAQLAHVRGGVVQQQLSRLLEHLDRSRHELDRIAVRASGNVILVRMDDIDWIEAADNYACLHCGAQTHVLRETMSALEARLDAARFIRIHRSAIVNISKIKELQPWFRGDYRVLLQNGAQLTLSRSYREKLQSRLLNS